MDSVHSILAFTTPEMVHPTRRCLLPPSAVIQPLKPPITLLIRLDLCYNRLIHICLHNHPQQRLLNNHQLIFFLYALDWNPSLAPIRNAIACSALMLS